MAEVLKPALEAVCRVTGDGSALHHLVRQATDRLEAAGVERPRWTAEQLVASLLGCEPLALAVEPPTATPARMAEIRYRVAQRCQGIPLQYLTGVAGFFGRDVRVGPGVFIPRPETERVVEVALRELARVCARTPVVADVGTGSGAIALSLTLEFPVATMTGFDISPLALGVAQGNARRLGVAKRVRWACADLLAPCPGLNADLIVANLPYIPSGALAALPREVQWDPPIALDGGPDGLALIRRLLAEARTRVAPRGVVVLEVGPHQAAQLRREYATRWSAVEVVCDDTGVERVVVFRGVRPHG